MATTPSDFGQSLRRFFGALRWVTIPLGLMALLAVGVHAAADTIDDRILWIVDQVDAFFDSWFARWPATASWVNWVEPHEATLVARAVTFVLEVITDVVIAIPALGYYEEDASVRGRARLAPQRQQSWAEVFRRTLKKPTLLRWTRPAATLCFALVGAGSLARMVQGQVYLSIQRTTGNGDALTTVARLASLAALVLVLGTLGWRAVLRSAQYADEQSEALCRTKVRALRVGLVRTVLIAPLAFAAWFELSLLGTFFQ